MKALRSHWRNWWIGIALGVSLAIWVLNASTAGGRAAGCPQGCASRPTRRAGPLRVISLNVLHDFPRFQSLEQRLDLIADEILRQDADLVLLQEVPWTPGVGDGTRRIAEKAGFNHLYLRAQGNRWVILFDDGVAILSRFPLLDPVILELTPREGFFEPRVVLSATVNTSWGKLPVFVTHLASSDDAVNQRQAESLREFVAARSNDLAIVAGDFNATPDSPQILALTQEWIDTYPLAYPSDPGLTCCIDDLNAPPDEILEERIDYVFLVSGDSGQLVSAERLFITPFSQGNGWLWASDHVGLLVELNLERQPDV
jgi:endonuclease/exonuclease/phosphatase family metal-dependent hydrolase